MYSLNISATVREIVGDCIFSCNPSAVKSLPSDFSLIASFSYSAFLLAISRQICSLLGQLGFGSFLSNLVSADVKGTVIRHYRVDKMQNIKILKEKRTGKEQFEGFDLAAFSNLRQRASFRLERSATSTAIRSY